MSDQELKLKFWGTRGLVSSPRKDTAKYGGNTPCIQVVNNQGNLLVDTGFGASILGESLIANLGVEVHILYTHFHWDHIQGLPFFHPIYMPENRITIYSPEDVEFVHRNLDILFDGSYSPFEGIDKMPAQINIKQLQQNDQILGFDISHARSDHGSSQSAHCYRLNAPTGESIAICTDHEARPSPVNNKVIDLCRDVDVLVHDSQYSESQYSDHQGWGHSTAKQALDNAHKMNAKNCLLTHHDPGCTDQEIDALFKKLKADPKYKNLAFDFAQESSSYSISELLAKTAKAG